MKERIKPNNSAYTFILAIIRIYNQEICPVCFSKEPYYRDCPICQGFVIGCDIAKKEDMLTKYISWVNSDEK